MYLIIIAGYGPRKVMAGLLIIGAIPSGLAGTVSTANDLYIVRFFIGILGGTFVSCQAWNTAFFDKSVVGSGKTRLEAFAMFVYSDRVQFTANALGGGWGNSGGGFTFIIMIALFNQLVADGLTPHVAWRAAFAIVPVPILLSVAAATLIFGTDHPAGKWSDRHKAVAATLSHSDDCASDFNTKDASTDKANDIENEGGKNVQTTVVAVNESQ